MNDGSPWSARYIVSAVANWLFFLLAVFALTWGSGGRLPFAALVAIVAVIGASVAWQFIAAYRLIARQDEFIRGITAKQMVAAAGITITLAVLWGLAEQFLDAPYVPMWVLYPLFWGLYGVVSPLVRTSRP